MALTIAGYKIFENLMLTPKFSQTQNFLRNLNLQGEFLIGFILLPRTCAYEIDSYKWCEALSSISPPWRALRAIPEVMTYHVVSTKFFNVSIYDCKDFNEFPILAFKYTSQCIHLSRKSFGNP